jgi:hypothetical protein
MAGSSNKVKVGAGWVYFGTVEGAVGEILDLGYTQGGITFSVETGSFEILVDQEGDTAISETITGRRVVVTAPLAESDYEKLQKIMPDSSYSNNLLEVDSGVGGDLMDYADELKILSAQSSSDWIKVYKAAPIASTTAVFDPRGVRVWNVQFKGYVPEVGHAHAGTIFGMYLS